MISFCSTLLKNEYYLLSYKAIRSKLLIETYILSIGVDYEDKKVG